MTSNGCLLKKINYKLIVNQTFIGKIILYDKSFSIFTKLKIFIKLFFNFYFLVIVLDRKKFSILCSLYLFGRNKSIYNLQENKKKCLSVKNIYIVHFYGYQQFFLKKPSPLKVKIIYLKQGNYSII
jgi:hypothetical protein